MYVDTCELSTHIAIIYNFCNQILRLKPNLLLESFLSFSVGSDSVQQTMTQFNLRDYLGKNNPT